MQVEFVIAQNVDSPTFSLDKKVGSLVKSYRPRTVQLTSNSLKYVGNSEDKGEDDLVGASVLAASNGTEIKLKLKGRKEELLFRSKNQTDGEIFVNQVRKAIRRANVQALQAGRNDAEVVEWYYQYQADLAREASFMANKHVVHMCHTLPGQAGIRKTLFVVTLPAERTGLLFTLDRAASMESSSPSSPSRLASLYNGRILLFTDITGVFLPSGKFEHDATGGLSFVLHTKEDELSLYLPSRGVEWLRAVQALCIFARIPMPSSRSPTVSFGTDGQATNSLADFRANSGAVFAPSSDVLLILRQLADKPGQSVAMRGLCEEISAVLRMIPDARWNREAMNLLGARIEELVRVLGDAETGLHRKVREEVREAFEAQLVALKDAFALVRAYLRIQRYAGWLKSNLDASLTAKASLDGLDAGLMAIVNKIISLLGADPALMFEKREYACSADVRKAVDSLGGLGVIYQDSIKERTLAKLIQAEAAEIARELAQMHGVTRAESQRTVHSSVLGVDGGNSDEDARKAAAARPWWYYLCCCCCCSCCGAVDKAAHKPKAQPSLREPLVAQ